MTAACFCACHSMSDDLSYKHGVDTRDYVACVLACDACRANHKPAYEDDPPSRPLLYEPPRPADATGDGDE